MKKRNRLKMALMVLAFLLAGSILSGGASAEAMVAEGRNAPIAVSSQVLVQASDFGPALNSLNLIGSTRLNDETSGVTELDNAATKTNKLVTWVCSWIGGLMALFGIIWAAINQASHNSDGRNQGIIVGAVGIVVAFAPQITNMILGK
jgi:hypothetical protein